MGIRTRYIRVQTLIATQGPQDWTRLKYWTRNLLFDNGVVRRKHAVVMHQHSQHQHHHVQFPTRLELHMTAPVFCPFILIFIYTMALVGIVRVHSPTQETILTTIDVFWCLTRRATERHHLVLCAN